ncbi:MAG: hypothetical protein QM804_04630 [Propionicimonas sp.]
MGQVRSRRRVAWLVAAAGLVVAAVVASQLLPARPLPGGPEPTSTAAISAEPSPSGSPWPPSDGWYRWTRLADAPIDVSQFTPTVAANGVYLVSEQPSCRRPTVHRYDPASDRWSGLPSPNLPWSKCFLSLATHGDDLYLLAAKSGTEVVPYLFWRYRAATGEWDELPVPRQGHGDIVRLAAGWLLVDRILDSDGDLTGVEYEYFDYATGRWSEGELSDPGMLRAAENRSYRPVTVEGRSLLLFELWPGDWTEAGEVTLVTWDPATNQQVLRTSHEVTAELLQTTIRMLQLAEPGIAYLGSYGWGSDSEALVVDLRDGRWSSVVLPISPGPLEDRYHSDASWANGYFGEAAAGYLVANSYLFNPATGRWLAVPWRGLPPSATEVGGNHLARIAPDVSCVSGGSSRECWKLTVEPLERIAAEVTTAQIAENNRLRPPPWPRPDWSRWKRAADAPIDASEVYGVRARHGTYLADHYYDATTDRWHKLPTLKTGCRGCGRAEFTHGDDLYVVVSADPDDQPRRGKPPKLPDPELWQYRLATDSWRQLPAPRLGGGGIVAMADGLLQISSREDGGGGLVGLTYAYFDYVTEAWREGDIPASEGMLEVAANNTYWPVRVDGRSLLLFADWPTDAGVLTLSLWDPVSNQVREIGREVSLGFRDSAYDMEIQVVEPGIAYLGSRWGSTDTRAQLVDLRDGTWSDLEIPNTEGPLGRRYQANAHWAKAYFADELAGYVEATWYLYNPTTQRWLAAPSELAAPPDEGTEDDYLTVEIAPGVRCLHHECWRWEVDPLESFAAEFTPSEVAENNRWRR